MLNNNDKAFQQIAILGFKTGSAADRIQAVKAFATAQFGDNVHVEISNEEKEGRQEQA